MRTLGIGRSPGQLYGLLRDQKQHLVLIQTRPALPRNQEELGETL